MLAPVACSYLTNSISFQRRVSSSSQSTGLIDQLEEESQLGLTKIVL
jgi:hypothetical protein